MLCQRNCNVDKMVVFKAKIWPMQNPKKKKERKEKGEKGHSDALRSQAEWAARPVVSNSCARNNKWCIHKLQKQGLLRGCTVCTRNDEQPARLLFHSSEKRTEFS